MKKKFFYAAIILLGLAICGCGKEQDAILTSSISEETEIVQNEPVKKQEADIETDVETESKTPELLDEHEILSMSNYMNAQKTVLNGAWIYGISFDSNNHGVLSKIKTDGTELTRLSDCAPSYINVIDGWIYYLAYDWAGERFVIKKIRVSGEDEKKLIEASDDKYVIQCMFIHNDKIYYAENYEPENGKIEGRLCCADLSGKNKKILIDKATYYPYIINDMLYYQDDKDDCKIHVCNIDGTDDTVLIDKWTYRYITDGKYIYYEAYKDMPEVDENHNLKGEEPQIVLRRCNIDGTDDIAVTSSADIGVLAMNPTTIYYSDMNDECRLYSYDIVSESVDLISQDDYVDSIALFPNSLSYYNWEKDWKFVENIYICNLDGTNQSEIFKE